MDNLESIWDLTSETAHPRARELIEPGSRAWDFMDPDSPLGTDAGADIANGYLEFRKDAPGAGAQAFIESALAELNSSLPCSLAWNAIDEKQLQQQLEEADEGTAIVRRDDTIIGLAFAQLLVEGAVDAEVKSRASFALQRQSTKAVIRFRAGDDFEEFDAVQAQHAELLEVLRRA